MKVINVHVIECNGGVGRFEELDDGRFLYLHNKLKPRIISKEDFDRVKNDKKLPVISSLS